MRNSILFFFLILCSTLFSQVENTDGQENRIRNIQLNLEALAVENAGLSETLKVDINVSSVALSNFLLAIAKVHQLNLNVDPNLQGTTIVNNFSNVAVGDLLVYLCKEYSLDIDFSGNILSIRKYEPPPPPILEKELLVVFDPTKKELSLDLKNDTLEQVFRKIIDTSGKNLLYNNGMENMPISIYLKDVPIELALEKMANANNLLFSKSRDGFYLFDKMPEPNENRGSASTRNGFGNNYNYTVLDTISRLLSVDFKNVPIVDIIEDISADLKLDSYTATPLTEAGATSFTAKQIYYDELLTKIFEGRSSFTGYQNANNDTNGPPSSGNRNRNAPLNQTVAATSPAAFTFKKENDIYFFGTEDQLSVRKLEVVQLMNRSVELLGDPSQNTVSGRAAGRTQGFGNNSVNFVGSGFQGQNTFGGNQNGFNNPNFNTPQRINSGLNQFGNNFSTNAEAIVNILPDEVTADLDIKVDFELNSFLISGPAAKINRFKNFIKQIDKPVPVVLIEVMLIEVRKTATVETGISWGIGDAPVQTRGGVFPETNITLGSNTVNRIIGGFDGFGSFNIGRVVPEFFATIKAMEQNGNIKIRSTPKLSTLNGHRANLSIGQTDYFVVTSQNFFGSQIPTSTEVRNFQPIDAELAVSIKPLVSGNGQVTLDINVIQSDFSGERIEEDAPPGLTSREFSSIIRMQNQDLAVLGGLEEKVKNDSGSGVPLLARIPIIKWLFSKRRREDSKQKLTILIKPTVIY